MDEKGIKMVEKTHKNVRFIHILIKFMGTRPLPPLLWCVLCRSVLYNPPSLPGRNFCHTHSSDSLSLGTYIYVPIQ